MGTCTRIGVPNSASKHLTRWTLETGALRRTPAACGSSQTQIDPHEGSANVRTLAPPSPCAWTIQWGGGVSTWTERPPGGSCSLKSGWLPGVPCTMPTPEVPVGTRRVTGLCFTTIGTNSLRLDRCPKNLCQVLAGWGCQVSNAALKRDVFNTLLSLGNTTIQRRSRVGPRKAGWGIGTSYDFPLFTRKPNLLT